MSYFRLRAFAILLGVAGFGVTGLLTEQAAAQSPGTPPSVLTIDQAVRLALDRNLSIESSRIAIESAEARVRSAFGTFLPTISASAGYNRYLTDGSVVIEGTPIPGAGRPDDYWRANATASLLLFDGFSRTANYSSAQSSLDASTETFQRARQNVAYQVRLAFLNAMRARQVIEVRQLDIETAREQLARLNELVTGGVQTIGVVYQQESEIATAELSLETARTDYVMAMNTLSQTMNFDPASRFELSTEGLLLDPDTVAIAALREQLGDVEALYERQLESRPDVIAARERVTAAEAAITAAKSGYYPSVSASLTWSWDRSGTVSSNDGIFGLGLQYTPFDGFATSERVQQAEAGYQTAQIELRQIELQARSDLQQALARLEGAERQLVAAQKAVDAARQSRYAADERFKAGVGNYGDYITASAAYQSARINQVNALFSYRLALYEIDWLVGRI